MTLFQLAFVPLCLLVGLVTLVRTAKGQVLRRNGAFWAAVWLGAAVFIAFPSTTTSIARWLGIGRGADLILYIAILAGLGGSLYFYQRFRRLEITVTELIRREALKTATMGSRPVKEPLPNPVSGQNRSL